jgi:hypothetical protein
MAVATSALIAAGVGLAGAGVAAYGANKNAKSQAAATAANKASVDSTNEMNYKRWLESQGVGANGESINTWLPRNFTVSTPVGQPRRFRRAGSAPASAPASAPVAPVAPAPDIGQFAQ